MREIIRTYEKQLKKCVLFSDSSPEEIETKFGVLEASFAQYEKDGFLHRAGEPLDRFGIVVYGRVKVLIDDIEGNTAIMAEVTPGNTFAESLCFLQYEHPEIYICAGEKTGVIWFSTAHLFIGEPSVRCADLERHFVEMLTKRTLVMNQRIQILSKLTLREKIVTYFTFALQQHPGRSLDVSLSREEMALYFGTNRSALSRELGKMKQEGLIDFCKNHFTVNF